MTKRLIDIEDVLLEKARDALGTKSIKETVAIALDQAIRSSERRTRLSEEMLKRFAEAALDLADDEVTASAWQ